MPDWTPLPSLNKTTLLLAGGATVAVLWWLTNRRTGDVPPGPGSPLPLLGHLDLLTKPPRSQFKKWRRQYGDVFSFYLCGRLVVVVCGYRAMREALVKKGDVFSDRPHFSVLSSESKGLTDTSCALWKAQRMAVLEILRKACREMVVADKVQEEIEHYVTAISEKHGRAFDISRLTEMSFANNMFSTVCGHRYDYDDPEFQQMMEDYRDFFVGLGTGGMVAMFPVLGLIPGDPWNQEKTRHCFRRLMDIVQESCKSHLSSYDENDVMDFMSGYITEIRKDKHKPGCPYANENNMAEVAFEIFAGGSKTLSATLLWAMVHLLHHPEVQKRCHEDVLRVVGEGRPPALSDRQYMTFFQATIMEVLRIDSVVQLSMPSETPCDATLCGYRVPQGTIVLPDRGSVLEDPDVWGDAERFRPERFIDAEGQLIQQDEFIPFSIGRRSCPGEQVSQIQLFLYLATLVQRFRLLPPEDGQLPSLEGAMTGIYAPRPFRLRAVLRPASCRPSTAAQS